MFYFLNKKEKLLSYHRGSDGPNNQENTINKVQLKSFLQTQTILSSNVQNLNYHAKPDWI